MKIARVNPPPLRRIERDDLPFYPDMGLVALFNDKYNELIGCAYTHKKRDDER